VYYLLYHSDIYLYPINYSNWFSFYLKM
jgi:hypothetical protein